VQWVGLGEAGAIPAAGGGPDTCREVANKTERRIGWHPRIRSQHEDHQRLQKKLWRRRTWSSDREVIVYLIRKNSQVPPEVDEDFETHTDHQAAAVIRIMEAEGDPSSTELAAFKAQEIKRVTLNLPPGLRKGSLIAIRYAVSEDGGRLRVTATEKGSGRSIDEKVDMVNALTQMEVDKAKQRALAQVILTRHQIELMCQLRSIVASA
jgi:molecular chaperone DnaK (HSP70)